MTLAKQLSHTTSFDVDLKPYLSEQPEYPFLARDEFSDILNDLGLTIKTFKTKLDTLTSFIITQFKFIRYRLLRYFESSQCWD